MSRLFGQWRLLLVAMLGIGLGILAISQTGDMSELGRVFPMTASLITIAAGSGVLIQIVLQRTPPRSDGNQIDYLRAALFALTMLIWAVALNRFGFIPTSGLAVVVVAVIARREPMSATSVIVHAVAGVVLVVGFSLLLSEVLNVRLP